MIRLAEEKDTKDIWEAHVSSIREICSKDYTPEQIQGWSAFDYSHEHWSKTMKKDHVIVFEENGKVLGFCHSNHQKEGVGEIIGLYLSPKAIGKGVGRGLVQEAIQYLTKEKISKIVLDATRTALPFYKKMGFEPVGPEQVYKARGAEFEYTPMEMNI